MADDGADEEDYMSMAIIEPDTPREKETYTQRRIRKEREVIPRFLRSSFVADWRQAEQKGRTKSKKELEAEAAAARDTALATSLPAESKGYKIMAKLGFKQGSALGSSKTSNARTEPIGLEVKEDRAGIGLDSEKKRKFQDEVEKHAKRVKAEEHDYRERVAKEREDRRLEGLVGAAIRLAEQMDEENSVKVHVPGTGVKDETKLDSDIHESGDAASTDQGPSSTMSRRLPRHVNVLWRSLVREREEKERERLMRHSLLQSLSRNAKYDDAEEDEQDRLALGKVEQDVEDEDPEVDAFNAREPAERLQMLVEHLRNTHNYCFWCKHQYPDAEMEGCPGISEDDHD